MKIVSLRCFYQCLQLKMTKRKIGLPAAAAAILLSAACNNVSDREMRVREDIGMFANRYFNYNFPEALTLCTPESAKWIRLAASNVTEADLDVLRAQERGAEAEVVSVDFGSGDTTAVATVRVSGFMLADTIGAPGHIVAGAEYRIPAVRRDGRWLVRMACPLRSGR